MHGEQISGRRFFKSPTFAKQATDLRAWEEVDEVKRLLAVNPLGEDAAASPVCHGDALLLRGMRRLWCLAGG